MYSYLNIVFFDKIRRILEEIVKDSKFATEF